MQVVEYIGGQGRNRTTDTRIFSPLLEQERFRLQEKILTDRTNEERAKLGLGPYQAPLAAMD